MTLAEMARFVARKTRAKDADAVADCKQYLSQRYKMLWEDQLWKDALRGYDFTFEPEALAYTYSAVPFGNYLSSGAGIWHLPSGVDRMLALRKADGPVGVEDQFNFYRTGIDDFAESGDPVKFFVLGHAARDLSGKADVVLAEGVTTLAGNADDAGVVLRIRYLDLDGEEQTMETALVAPPSYGETLYPGVILSVTKAATTGTADLILDGDYVIRMAAADTEAKQYLRIRIAPIPTANTDLKALVKLKAQTLAEDGDVPQLRGIENTLLAFAQGDVLERQRRYSQAQAKFQEGTALLEQLKRTEVMQEAVLTRIQPEVSEVSGSVDDYSMPGKGWL